MIQRSSQGEPLDTRSIIRHVKFHYDEWQRELKADENLEIMAPLSDGTRLSLRKIHAFAPNFVLVQGEDASGKEVDDFTSPYGLQFIFRIISKKPETPKREISFVLGKI